MIGAPSPAARRVWLAAALAAACALGALSHWVIFEYDLFWEVRAGREILSGLGVQSVDRWSHTALGQPWHNFQWLSTVLMALAAKLSSGAAASYAALSWLRSLLVAAWILLLARLARSGPRPWLLAISLLPWLYLASWFRLQMRPDLFGLVAFAALLALLVSDVRDARKKVSGLLLLLIWANLHAGTVVFGILVFGMFTLTARIPWRKRCLLAGAGFLTWFATPGGFTILQVVRDNALLYDWSKTRNPDLQPFSFDLLDFSRGGWAIRLWLAWCALAVASLWQPRERLPALYQSRWFLGVAGAALTLESLHHIRAAPYQMVFFLPLVAAPMGSLKSPRTQLAVLSAIALFCWGYVLPWQVQYVAHPLGEQVSALDVPVASTAFLAATRPAGKLQNAYPFGGYLVGELPEYPVSMDGRELPFLAYRDAMNRAIEHGSYGSFLSAHGIDIALEELPAPLYDPQRGARDPHEALYPRSEWATVFFDNVSVVYLRRTQANAALIAAHEYQLHRGLPATWAATAPGLGNDVRNTCALELQRCLREVPDSLWCRVGLAAFFSHGGNPSAALELLTEARRISPNNLEVLVALVQLAIARKDQPAIDELVHRLDRVGSRSSGG